MIRKLKSKKRSNYQISTNESKEKIQCKICGYVSKQLSQHIKAVHGINSIQYRNIYGIDCIMQVGFAAPIKKSVNVKLSNQVKGGYNKIQDKLKNIKPYSIKQCKNKLLNNELYIKYLGKTNFRKLIVDDIRLYKSIFYHTIILESYIPRMSPNKRFTDRMLFLVNYDADITKIKCGCGKYSLNKYNRNCKCKRKYPAYNWFVDRYPNTYEIEYQKYILSRPQFEKSYSKISQELFNMIKNECKLVNVNYATYNGEWKIFLTDIERAIANQRLYYLDFKYGNKNIEFDSQFGRFIKDADYISIRDSILNNRGFRILRVEEAEYRTNPNAVVNKCIQFLNEK